MVPAEVSIIGLFFIFTIASACLVAYFVFRFYVHSIKREISELNYDVETIQKQNKRRAARDGMQEKRDQEKSDDELLAQAQAFLAANGGISGASGIPDQGADPKAALRAQARRRSN